MKFLYVLIEKLKEVMMSVIPITLIVLVLNFTLVPLETHVLIRFILGAILIIFGLTIFLFGVDIGVTPIGTLMGSFLAKSNKIWIVGLGGLLLGFFISVAEPDLQILAGQVSDASSGLIGKNGTIMSVSIGVAVLMTIGLFRIIYKVSIQKLLTICYGLVLFLAIFTPTEFLGIAFDASGATTGAMTVPFFLALAFGVSSLKKGGVSSEEDSFGLVGITSIGAILAIMITSIISNPDKITGTLPTAAADTNSILLPFLKNIPILAVEIAVALLPILVVYLVFQKISFKQSKKAVKKVLKGLVYTFIGLVMFLLGVNSGFMEVGRQIGYKLASYDNKAYIVIIAFFLGLVVVLAEPAVYVLTHQVEDVTSGYVKGKSVLFALSLGIGVSVALAIVKIIVPEIQLWHYLLPAYLIAILTSYIVPNLFVGIAFDAGVVPSGPMTASFILAFAQGAAGAIPTADVLTDGFGIIAMVAMAPLITIQILGLIFKAKSRKGGLENNE